MAEHTITVTPGAGTFGPFAGEITGVKINWDQSAEWPRVPNSILRAYGNIDVELLVETGVSTVSCSPFGQERYVKYRKDSSVGPGGGGAINPDPGTFLSNTGRSQEFIDINPPPSGFPNSSAIITQESVNITIDTTSSEIEFERSDNGGASSIPISGTGVCFPTQISLTVNTTTKSYTPGTKDGASGFIDIFANTADYVSTIIVTTSGDACTPDAQECQYTTQQFSFRGYTFEDVSGLETGGYFKASGEKWDKKSLWLCSNDCLTDDSNCVILKTRDSRYFLTRCDRINFGKIPTNCRDIYHKIFRWLTRGLEKDLQKSNKLDEVSVGIIVSSTLLTANVKTTVGEIEILNDFGSIISVDTEVVIYNPTSNNEFAKVLGPTNE